MPNLPLGTYRDTPLTVLQRYTPAIVLLWVTGVFAMMMRLVSGCWVTHRLRRVGISPLPEEWLHRVRQLAADLGLRRGVEVVVSSVATVPMVVGALRPVVLVPVATLFGLTPQQLEAILVHELEHVRRYDGVVILVQRLVETLLFYHPAVWWISSCVQREREFCCDDTVAARADARLYAEALTALEGLRTPVTVAASTDGPLLSRVRRLLALDSSSPATPPRVTLPNVIGTLALFAALALGASSSVSSEKAMAQPANGVLLEDVRVPTRSEIAEASMGEVWLGSGGGNGGTFSTIVDAYVAALAAGGDDWSAPHVAATFGYPFHFVLKEGAVQHDHNCNIETSLFFERMNDLGWGTVRFVEATGGGNEPNMERLTARREEAWEAVTASIDRGMPAIAWSPLQDHHFSDWGLLVGYDADTESYHVSHVQTDSVYTIPFDGFGQAWFHVIVFTERTEADPRIADVATLRHAVEFSKGLRYSAEESRSCGVDAIGFDAYRLWIDALASGEFDPAVAREHAWQLMHTRQLAAEYTSQAANRFEGAVRARLQRASDHYVQQSEVCRQLLDIVTPWATQAWTPSEAEEARKLVELALSWERGAVMFLEVALLNLGEEIPGEPTNPGVAMLQSEPRAVVEVAVAPTEPHRGTTLASTLEPVLHTLGRDGWTQARIQGVLGHAFQFQMAEGGVDVWHDNLDWSLGLEVLQQIAQLRTYDAQKEAPAAEREIAQREARDAVRESLKRGVPAIVWNPKTLAKREAGHPGGRGVCWGLIVGYDESQQSYTIRHPFVWQGDYTIGYDEIGDAGATNWLNVMVFDEARKADDDELHRMALRNALSFADGTRQGEHRWTQGFHAYETWLVSCLRDN
jgi:beta-lactamase regulating signal transducer with metallopeptidase domain